MIKPTTNSYSKEVLEHFSNPHNMGEMKNADAIGELGNPSCGDVMRIYLKVGKNKDDVDFIEDIKFQTMGYLSPQEKIFVGEEWKNINSLSIGEKIINSSGEKTKIK